MNSVYNNIHFVSASLAERYNNAPRSQKNIFQNRFIFYDFSYQNHKMITILRNDVIKSEFSWEFYSADLH